MGARYAPYDSYRESNIPWLGAIPEHWEVRRAKAVFERVQRDVRAEDGIVTAFRDGEVTLRSKRREEGFTNAVKEIGYQGVRKGDLLVHAMDGFAGAIGVSDSNGKCSPVCSVCVPWRNVQIHMNYYGYLVRQLAVTDFIMSLAKGIRERSTEFRYSEFSVQPLAFPSFEEQKKIANFLDHETAKIDTLIEKQQRLMELLKEKRQAVISHTVTKGLNPNALMRDSGVEWIGSIPNHWEVAEIRRITVEHRQGYYSESDYSENGHRVARITDILDNNVLDVSNSPFYEMDEENRRRYELKKGDFVFQRTGAHKKIGIFESDEPSIYASYLIRFRFNDRLNHKFLLNYFNSKAYEDQLNEQIHGGVNPNIHAENIKVCKLVIPPLSEQKDISDYILGHLGVFDTMIEKAVSAIEFMQERRTALISAAVTGKIDVRAWEAPNV